MAKFILKQGVQAQYDALVTKDNSTVYFLTDSGNIYIGEHPMGAQSAFTGASINSTTDILTFTSANGGTSTVDLSIYNYDSVIGTHATNISNAQSTANQAYDAAVAAQSTADAKVATVAAADLSVVVAGTSTAKTVKANISADVNNVLKLVADGLKVADLKLNANEKTLTYDTDGLRSTVTLGYSSTTNKIALMAADGTTVLSEVVLPSSSILSSVETVSVLPPEVAALPEHEGEIGPWLHMVFATETGSGPGTQHIYQDLNGLVDTYTASNGIAITSGAISVKKDLASEAFLVVGADGVKVTGVQTAIDSAAGTALSSANTHSDALTVNGYALSTTPVLKGSDLLLGGYAIGTDVSAIATTDSIMVALQKLEAASQWQYFA